MAIQFRRHEAAFDQWRGCLWIGLLPELVRESSESCINRQSSSAKLLGTGCVPERQWL